MGFAKFMASPYGGAIRLLQAHGWVRDAITDVNIRILLTEIQRLRQQLAVRTTAAPTGTPEIKVEVTMPGELNVNLVPSAGTVVDYNADGTVAGTRPRGGA